MFINCIFSVTAALARRQGAQSYIVQAMEVGIAQAESILKAGDALMFPTDTVWGIGVAVAFAEGTQALAEAKGRASDKPIAWLVPSPDALAGFGSDVPIYARALAAAFWPGPLTLVVNASNNVPEGFRTAAGTVGLRMPASEAIIALASTIASPVAATSANFAGNPAIPSDQLPSEAFLRTSQLPVLKVEGIPRGSSASTVIDCTTSAPRLLRAGTISASEIESVCGIPVSA